MFTASYLWSHPSIGTNCCWLACSVLQTPGGSKITDLKQKSWCVYAGRDNSISVREVVSCPNPTSHEEKDLVTIERFLGCADQVNGLDFGQANEIGPTSCKHVIKVCSKSILLTCHNQEIAQLSPDPFSSWEVASGHERKNTKNVCVEWVVPPPPIPSPMCMVLASHL